jgi:hypothetical protein
MEWILGGLSAALAAAVGFGVQVPLIGNGRAAYAVLLVMGMALCSRGIKPDVYGWSWTNPFTIIGIVAGALALVLSVLYLVGLKVPLITSDKIAILALAGIMALKVVVAVVRGAVA